MSLRFRRLMSEEERLTKSYAHSDLVTVRPEPASPPERYEVDFHVKGLECLPGGELVSRSEHTIEIVLPAEFPRRPPICKMKTPIFHPNIDTWDICTSDHWAAQETLVDLVVRIGQMITYQSHNTKSPLNADAARWCDENESRLPVDSVDLHPPDPFVAAEVLQEAISKATQALDETARCDDLSHAHDCVSRARDALKLEAPVDETECASLLRRRAQLLAGLDRLQMVISQIESCSRIRAARVRRNEAIAVLDASRERVEDCVRRASSLVPPPWIGNGSLTPKVVQQLATDARDLTAALRAALQTARDDTVTTGEDSLSDDDLPREARCLYETILGSPSVEAMVFADELIHESEEDIQRLDRIIEATALLRSAFDAVSATDAAIEEAASLNEMLQAHPDTVCLIDLGQQNLIAAGEEQEIGPETIIRCRIKSSNSHISLTDGHGHQLAELQTMDSTELHGLYPPITAKLHGPSSRLAFERAKHLYTSIPTADHFLEAATRCQSPLPNWWDEWSDPVSSDQRARATKSLKSAMKRAKRCLQVSRARTQMLDLRALLKHGQEVVAEVKNEQRLMARASARITEITGHAKKRRDGVMRLRADLLEEYDALQEEFQTRSRQCQQQLRRLRKCEVGLETALTDLQASEALAADDDDTAQALRSQISDACAEGRANLAHWKSHHRPSQ